MYLVILALSSRTHLAILEMALIMSLRAITSQSSSPRTTRPSTKPVSFLSPPSQSGHRFGSSSVDCSEDCLRLWLILDPYALCAVSRRPKTVSSVDCVAIKMFKSVEQHSQSRVVLWQVQVANSVIETTQTSGGTHFAQSEYMYRGLAGLGEVSDQVY
ncbi:hypothetical protein CPLU01_05996 [Colletotrichum plurivorum]|uniref:Uncharacterized protein n=1 Tax=Colletotrichum plurivorum TaxID=2175906 RepID=A0A8H6KJP9_9PEZI|nr:hypothetical protein CPLU01_05996 [Colletotrichum plurivorum]